MLGMVTPRRFLNRLVITPLRPSSKIQEYAPTNGADMLHKIMKICKTRAPLISYRL